MLRLSAHHRRMDCLFPLVDCETDYKGASSRRVHVLTAWSSLDQYLSTDSTVCVLVIPCCPIRCDVEILMAPGGKPSCLTTLPAVRHCQSQCEPTDSQTHLQSDGGLRCS